MLTDLDLDLYISVRYSKFTICPTQLQHPVDRLHPSNVGLTGVESGMVRMYVPYQCELHDKRGLGVHIATRTGVVRTY